MGISGIMNSSAYNLTQIGEHSTKTYQKENVDKGSFLSLLNGEKPKTCPYDHLAKNGVIEYNGVTFLCDYKTNSICLGDMTNEKEVLNISLPSGGNLKVNINNIGSLARAAGMFSPADFNAIMRAIAQYNHCTSKLNELEEEETETIENATEPNTEQIEERSISGRRDLNNVNSKNTDRKGVPASLFPENPRREPKPSSDFE